MKESLVTKTHSNALSSAQFTAHHSGTSSLSQGKTTNPLTSKIASVLSTSYTDSDFRDTLDLFDKRALQHHTKINRRLRLDLHKEVIDRNSDVLNEFGKVAEELRRIRGSLEKLNGDYEQVKSRVVKAHSSTSSSLIESASLLKEHKEAESKRLALNSMQSHFLLSEDDVAVLTSTAEPVNQDFFDTLTRVKNIKRDCEVLLGFDDQTLGLELMDQLSGNLNLGYQKLYKWTQKEFKTLNLENPQISINMRRALKVLTERPSLFQNCLDFFAIARQRILSDSFHTALTGTMAGVTNVQNVKPIDLTAHDPLRYAGDMLAWIHSATVGEREVLEIVFITDSDALAQGFGYGDETEIWSVAMDETKEKEFNATDILSNLVDRSIAGAARELRQRMEQVIQGNEETIPAYKLLSLLTFYKSTFEKLVDTKGSLQECMESLETTAMRQFRALVRDRITMLRADVQHAPEDLKPPPFFLESLKQLDAIIETFELSLSKTLDYEPELHSILEEAFEPFMLGCDDMAKSLSMPNNLVFIINCRIAALKCLSAFDIKIARVQTLQTAIKSATLELTQDQHTFFVSASGLASIIANIKSRSTDNLSTIEIGELGRASQILDNFLPSAHMDAMDRLHLLQDSKIAREVTEMAAKQFCEDFEELEAFIIEDPLEIDVPGSPSLREIFPRTTAEIKVLLS